MDSPPGLPASQLRGSRTTEAPPGPAPVQREGSQASQAKEESQEASRRRWHLSRALKDGSQHGAPQARNSPSSRPRPSYLTLREAAPRGLPRKAAPLPLPRAQSYVTHQECSQPSSPLRLFPTSPPPSVSILVLAPTSSPSLQTCPWGFPGSHHPWAGQEGVAPYAKGWGFLKNLPQTLQPEGKGSSQHLFWAWGLGSGSPTPCTSRPFSSWGSSFRKPLSQGPKGSCGCLGGGAYLSQAPAASLPSGAAPAHRVPLSGSDWPGSHGPLSLAVAPTGAGRGVAHRCWEEDRVHRRPVSCPALPTSFPRHSLSFPRPLTCLGSPAPQSLSQSHLRWSEPPKCCTSLDAPMAHLPQADTPPHPRAQAPAGM